MMIDAGIVVVLLMLCMVFFGVGVVFGMWYGD